VLRIVLIMVKQRRKHRLRDPIDPYLLWRILLTSLKRKMAVNFGSSAWSADYRGSVIDSDGKA
jgi:hypothetical protein